MHFYSNYKNWIIFIFPTRWCSMCRQSWIHCSLFARFILLSALSSFCILIRLSAIDIMDNILLHRRAHSPQWNEDEKGSEASKQGWARFCFRKLIENSENEKKIFRFNLPSNELENFLFPPSSSLHTLHLLFGCYCTKIFIPTVDNLWWYEIQNLQKANNKTGDNDERQFSTRSWVERA